MNGKITKKSKNNTFKQIQLRNEQLSIAFLPELGGKMIRLKNLKTGTQYLKTPLNPGTDYHKSNYGEVFKSSDAFGFDECFPTVEPSAYENPFADKGPKIQIPDHGELWSLPWNYEYSEDKLILSIRGKKLDYEFRKSITLLENVVRTEYTLINLSTVPFHYVWSAHPLLDVSEGDQLLLPDEIKEVFLNWSSDPRLGSYGKILTWPYLFSNEKSYNDINFSIVQSKTLEKSFKLFTSRLSDNRAGLYRTNKDETVLFHFNPTETSFLGLWLCYGGWPENEPAKHFTVGIEPTSGRPDSLSNAIEENHSTIINGNQTHHWYLDISLWQGKINV